MDQNFTFYKGDINSTPYNMDSDTKLDNVRKTLISQGFMTSTESSNFRFINYQNSGLSYEDMVVGVASEKFVPLNGIQGQKSQIYLTNVNAQSGVDLIGFNTDWFFDRYMGCNVTLNMEAGAATANAGKFPPLMLTNVKMANPNIRGIGAMDNVVICEKDSIISFGIGSWGAAGYGYTIGPQAGTPINDAPLYVCFSGCPGGGNYARSGLSRYFSSNGGINQQMIKVVATDTMNIGDKTLQYMKFSVKTWKVSSYKDSSGTTHNCDQPIPVSQGTGRTAGDGGGTPYNRITGGETVVPGGTIQPGSTVPAGQQSSQVFGTISNVSEDNSPSGIIGEVIFYIFVFKTHDDATAVFKGINDIDPSVWNR